MKTINGRVNKKVMIPILIILAILIIVGTSCLMADNFTTN